MLASIQRIETLTRILNADRIEVAHVLGWRAVVRKGEFQPGDLCVFVQIDTILPRQPWSEFLADKARPDKPIRLKTCRLRGELSQGLCLPLSILSDPNLGVGTDVTDLLKIEKYIKQIPIEMRGDAKGALPSYVPHTDEELLQNVPSVIQELQGIEVYGSLKIDGTSATFARLETEIDVCGRNWSFQPSETNLYWRMYRQYEMNRMFEAEDAIAIQGEIAGPGIQGNKLGLRQVELFVFNLYDIANHHYLGYADLKSFCAFYRLQMVPVLDLRKFDLQSVAELLEHARGDYPDTTTPREGVVWRSVEERYSEALHGRTSFKVVNNDFAEKFEE